MENKEQSQNVSEQAKLSKQDEKAARKTRMRERRLARRAKRNARIARGRLFKNIVIWLLGFVALPIVIAAAAFVVPIGVITGNNGEYVSEDLSKRSVVEVVKFVAGNPGDLGFSDLPIIARELSDLQDMQIGEKGDEDNKTPIKVGDLIHIDTDKLNTIKFGDGNMASEVTSCIEVIATIESVGGASALGDFGALNVFTDEEQVCIVSEVGEGKTLDNTATDFEPKEYYYKIKELDGTAEDNVYKRAFNDDKSLVGELNALSDEKKAEVYIYYPPLEKIKLGELKDIIGASIGRTTISSLLGTLGGGNPTINSILGEDTKIRDISNFDINDVALSTVLENDSGSAKLYDILEDLTDKQADAIKIGDLSNIDTNELHLNTVLDNVDLTDNKVLSALKAKNIQIKDIGTALNGLSLYEVYGNSAFVEITVDNPAPVGARTFNKGTYHDAVNDIDKVCFDYDEYGNGGYYLDNTAGIWLILCYDTVTYNSDESVNTRFADSNGNPTKYIADELTVGDLQNGNSFSKKFRNATLKQLIDTKLVNGDELGGGTLSNKTQKLSLQEIIEILASPTVQAYINTLA